MTLIGAATLTTRLITQSGNTQQNFGILTSSTTPSATSTFQNDAFGNIANATVNGLATAVTMDSSLNTVPVSIQTGTSSQTMQWNSFLGLKQSTGQNGDTAQIGYDSAGRPASTTSPYGAVTNYTYVNYTSATSPATITATTTTPTSNHFTRQTLDGLGHVIQTDTGTVSGSTYTTTSTVLTQYAPCGCSPL